MPGLLLSMRHLHHSFSVSSEPLQKMPNPCLDLLVACGQSQLHIPLIQSMQEHIYLRWIFRSRRGMCMCRKANNGFFQNLQYKPNHPALCKIQKHRKTIFRLVLLLNPNASRHFLLVVLLQIQQKQEIKKKEFTVSFS